MNAQPSSYPTTSDISAFMRGLGYKWSNEAQIYYEISNYESYITRKAAEKMYERFVGKTYYPPEVHPLS